MKNRQLDCIDAGSEHCPCYLAQTEDCLICGRLSGKQSCADCHWQGVCVYNEFQQSGGRIASPRREFSAPVAEKKEYADDVTVFVLDVGRGFAGKCSWPGSYVFLRAPGERDFYDTPVSVMRADADRGQIHLAVKQIAAKTKALLRAQDALQVRGVYRNGIQGVKAVDPRWQKGASVLLLAKGIGLAPAVMIADTLNARNQVDLIVDTEKISRELVTDYVTVSAAEAAAPNDPAAVRSLQFESLSALLADGRLKSLLAAGQYQSVAVLASDYYVQTIPPIVRECLPDAAAAVSGNFRLCCGEGICGACSVEYAGGETLKMCKCQLGEARRFRA